MHQIFGATFTISYAAWLLVEIWVFSRDRRKAEGEVVDRGSLLTIGLAVVGSMIVSFWAAAVLQQATISTAQSLVFSAGIGLMWSGLGLRLWAISTLGRFFRTTVVVQDQHRLISSGPYRLLRHPAYSGSILTMIGLGLALDNWVSLAAMLLGAALAYLWRIRAEEAALGARFGDAYVDYRRGTWAVFPGVW
jgi:protein-S-isoprenylcysteine O-methyltransferase